MSRYFIFYKPFGVLSQFTGEPGQRTLAEFGFPDGVYAAGRLDKDSEGLLLLTDDGPFIHKLLDPKFKSWKTYYVQVEGIPDAQALSQLEKGVMVKGKKTRPARVKLLEAAPTLPPRDPPIRFRQNIPTSWLEIEIREGMNRQVRRMTAAVGYPTLRLCRYQIAGVTLENLRPGEFRAIDKSLIKST